MILADDFYQVFSHSGFSGIQRLAEIFSKAQLTRKGIRRTIFSESSYA